MLVQPQIQGLYSGVAFSRDPLETESNQVVIEWLSGQAEQIVSGKQTPHRVTVNYRSPQGETDSKPELEHLSRLESDETIPDHLLIEIADVARTLEIRFHGIPQDVEWTFDGETLWILQSRPITTLMPIWTRKIAAEVIPGVIHPLTWSMNQPITCKVWGDLFTVVLGSAQSQNLDFQSTATLHYGRAYFNASLLGDIFMRMGLPPESLEFLIYDAPMSSPKGRALLNAIPGLLRLLGKEINLPKTFRTHYQPETQQLLNRLEQTDPEKLVASDLLQRLELIQASLTAMTYFQIMGPISVSLRQKIFRVSDSKLNAASIPENMATKVLAQFAQDLRSDLEQDNISIPLNIEQLTTWINQHETSRSRFDAFVQDFGYLSEVATDIAVPTWREDSTIIYRTLCAFLNQKAPPNHSPNHSMSKTTRAGFLTQTVQKRLDLKGTIAQTYNQLLAHLRWTILALEQQWIDHGYLNEAGDIFFLKIDEIKSFFDCATHSLKPLIDQRKTEFEQVLDLAEVPSVVYGQARPITLLSAPLIQSTETTLKGIGASAGQTEGVIQVVLSLGDLPEQINRDMILVVPFTDAAWAPIFSQAGGIISEVGGRLSHGAIMAREYGIPAVMDVSRATKCLKNGQKVRMNGWTGLVECL